MAIIINIDVMLAKRKMSVTELAEKVGITMANISVLKNGKAKAIRLSTLEAICKALECQPGDILEYREACGCGGEVTGARVSLIGLRRVILREVLPTEESSLSAERRIAVSIDSASRLRHPRRSAPV